MRVTPVAVRPPGRMIRAVARICQWKGGAGTSPRTVSRLGKTLAAGTLVLAGISATASGAREAAGPPASGEQGYDIPAQPLTGALASFARTSGVDIFYETTQGTGKTSTSVRGRFSAQAALHRLLSGTGLSARFTKPRAAIIYLTAGASPQTGLEDGRGFSPRLTLDTMRVRAPLMVGSQDRAAYQRYAQTTLHSIRRMLSEAPYLRQRALRLQVALVIDPAGRVERATLIQGSGDEEHDAHIRRLLLDHTLAPPPAGFREALHFELSIDRLGSEERR